MNGRIGIDLGGTKIEAIALDRAGREVFRKRVHAARRLHRHDLRGEGARTRKQLAVSSL
jgi:predicted NBD/HSP70 family sugar kinase